MERNQRAKGFIMGILVCTLVMTMVVPALGASTTKQLNATYNNIKLVIDGKTVVPKDVNGTVAEPFIVNGTTYLPVRALSEALGKNVNWDGATSTVYVGAIPGKPSIYLKDMRTLIGTAIFEEATDNLGNTHYNAMRTETVSYALDGKYKQFTGTFILKNQYKSDSDPNRLQVFLDGALAYTGEIKAGVRPYAFNVDVTNAIDMKLVFMTSYQGRFYSPNYNVSTSIVDAALWE